MKKMKKLLSVLLVLVMVFATGITAFAADTAADTIKVLLNGKYVTFTDANPKVVDGRTMVPYRAIFEALGADVEWDQATTTVTATTDELTMNFVVGTSDINITYKDGTKAVKKMDVVPFVENGRTMVPVRFISESMGYGVGWDQAEKTAIIIDWDTLVSELGDMSKDFSIISKMNSTGTYDENQAYSTKGDYKMKAEIKPEIIKEVAPTVSGPLTFTIDGTIDGVSKGMDVDAKMTMSADLTQLDTLVTSEADKASMEEMKAMLSDLEMQTKFNGTTGEFYFQSDKLAESMDLEAGTWISMDLYKGYEDMGIDLEAMMDSIVSNPEDMASVFTTALKATTEYTVDTYDSVKTAYSIMKSLVGDSAFTKTTSGTTTTYTAEITSAKVLAALTSSVKDISAQDLADLKAKLESVLSLSGKIVVTENGSVVTGYEMNLSAKADTVSCAINAKATETTSNVTLSMGMDEVGSFEMTMNSTVEKTTASVNTSLPAGAKVVDYFELLGL